MELCHLIMLKTCWWLPIVLRILWKSLSLALNYQAHFPLLYCGRRALSHQTPSLPKPLLRLQHRLGLVLSVTSQFQLYLLRRGSPGHIKLLFCFHDVVKFSA